MPQTEQKTTRSDRKEATRRRILTAALQLVEEGRSPEALGLREVARAAGMAAPSLYNHFADMDELGLALVDECLLRMRAIARGARKEIINQETEVALKSLLQQFDKAVAHFEPVLRLLIMQWFNPNPEYRRSIRRELSIMRREMASDMKDAAQRRGQGNSEYEIESDAIFSLLITFVLNVLDMGKEKRAKRLAILERQILMVVLGSRALNS
ncbi:MAG: TetR family transcriptional regulator [Ketobacter sp.]|nr:MAG: TetR family transcriptional regulator [Ketobacter sp.]